MCPKKGNEMNVYSAKEIDTVAIVSEAVDYASRTTYSDMVLINNGNRPLPGEFLTHAQGLMEGVIPTALLIDLCP